jgi:flagellum-specific peptidoglycan hydrolase FlgJ
MANQTQIKQYVEKFEPYLRKKSDDTGIPFEWTISHIAIESGYGLSAPNYNFMGIKGNAQNGQLLWTWEAYNDPAEFNKYPQKDPSTLTFKNGKYYMKVKTWFMKFNSMESAIDYYYNLLATKPRYKWAIDEYKQGNQTPWVYGYNILKSGYATTNSQVYANNTKTTFEKNIKPYLTGKTYTGFKIVPLVIFGTIIYILTK